MLLQHELPEDLWSDLLGCIKLVLNSTVQDSMGVSPAQLVYGARLAVACRCVVGACG